MTQLASKCRILRNALVAAGVRTATVTRYMKRVRTVRTLLQEGEPTEAAIFRATGFMEDLAKDGYSLDGSADDIKSAFTACFEKSHTTDRVPDTEEG